MRKRDVDVPRIVFITLAIIINIILIFLVLRSIAEALDEREENFENNTHIENTIDNWSYAVKRVNLLIIFRKDL